MTKTLTEQWREGNLPEDCYYILTENGHIRKDRTCFYSHTDEQCFCFTSNKDIEEVLAPVPSYDKWKQTDEQIENLQKMCEDECSRRCRLEEQLAIATKALNNVYHDMKCWTFISKRDERVLSVICEALKEMEGVK